MVEEVEEDEKKYLFAWYHEELPQREDNMEIYTVGKVPLSHVKGEEDMFIKEKASANDKKDTPIFDAKTEIKIYMSRKLNLIILYSLLLVLCWFNVILKALDVKSNLFDFTSYEGFLLYVGIMYIISKFVNHKQNIRNWNIYIVW